MLNTSLKDQNSKLKILAAVFCILFSLSCQEKKKEEDAPNVVEPPVRQSTVVMLSVQNPDGKGGFYEVSQRDFVNGHYGSDFVVRDLMPGFDPKNDETTAEESGIFMAYPGLLWKLEPPAPVIVALSSRGLRQEIKREATYDGKLGISFMTFSEVFPPAFRERYDLQISSIPGATHPFSYTYSFYAKRLDASMIFAKVSQGDGAKGIRMGRDTTGFIMAQIEPMEECPNCIIEVENTRLVASVKEFVELPTLPNPSSLRISFPKRFTGLIVKNKSRELTPTIQGNNTSKASIRVNIPFDLTTVQPWCVKKVQPAGTCPAKRQGIDVPTYFRFVNVVPFDQVQKSLGGSSGIASISISGSATISIVREGFVMEKKEITFDSGVASPLDNQTLPTWALDDLRNALHSGAPEFFN